MAGSVLGGEIFGYLGGGEICGDSFREIYLIPPYFLFMCQKISRSMSTFIDINCTVVGFQV